MKFLMIFIIVVLTGCIGNSPSESEGREVLEKSISNKAELLSFKKTNGEKHNGEYVMYFEAELVYPNGVNTQCIVNNSKIYNWNCYGRKVMNIGEKELQKGHIFFRKTENGWIGEIGYN